MIPHRKVQLAQLAPVVDNRRVLLAIQSLGDVESLLEPLSGTTEVFLRAQHLPEVQDRDAHEEPGLALDSRTCLDAALEELLSVIVIAGQQIEIRQGRQPSTELRPSDSFLDGDR